MFNSSWTNPQNQQQQQQQQQTGSAFGQPGGFGTGGGAFGSGGTFGQPQQPQANPMFGGLGTNNTTNTGTTGFGTFGSNTNQNNATGSLFGAPKPTTGFGAFGGGAGGSGGGTFGGGGAFGTNTNSTSAASGSTGIFGSSTANTGTTAFGGGGGLFGNKPATGFGATNTSATQPGVPVTTGTANPGFTAYTEKDGSNTSITLQYQTITAMEPYRGSSVEELRFQDYQQGRKIASAGGAFSQTSAFGTTNQNSTTGSGIFGQQTNTQPTNSIFGGGGFSSTNNNQPASGAFGGGTFGQNSAAQNTNATGTGLFGGGFGQTQQQQPTTGFGTFGTTPQQQPAAGGGIFGNSAFGAQQNKPATGFSGFGANNTNTTTGSAFGSGTFGQNSNQQPATTGGLFGQQTQQPANTFGTFGQNTNNVAKPGGIFGSTQPTTQNNTPSGFGLFGTNQQQANPPQQPAGGLFGNTGGLFGNNNQQQNVQQPNQGGGLFGTQTQPAQQPSGGLFGGGGGLFGNNNTNTQNQQQPAQQNSFGLFGQKPTTVPTAPAGGGLFSSTFGQTNNNSQPGQQPSLFANTLGQSSTQQPATNTFSSGGLFGNKSTAPSMGMSTSTQGVGLGGSLFGNSLASNTTFNASTANAGAQGSLTASIAQPIGANLPIFSMLPPGPRAVTLDQQPKKKPGFFVDVPTRSPVPRLQLGYTPANTKLRGFASQASSSTNGSGNPFSPNLSFTSGKPNALSLSKRIDSKSSLGPDAFLNGRSSPSLGSGSRQSVKKLVLDKKVDPSDLFSKSNGGSPGSFRSSIGGKVTFSPALSVAQREKEAAAPPHATASPTPAARGQKLNKFTAHSTNHVIDLGSPEKQSSVKEKGPAELQEGDYWVKPDLETLKNTGYEELSAFKNLIVGRVGYGEIHFLEPVDLTGLPKLSALLGQLVRFDDKECSVYPDSDDVDKPPPGSGLNVRARIILFRCWSLDKATREPIKDEKHPIAIKHLKRLKNMKDTHFEDFVLEEGKWTFTVDHF